MYYSSNNLWTQLYTSLIPTRCQSQFDTWRIRCRINSISMLRIWISMSGGSSPTGTFVMPGTSITYWQCQQPSALSATIIVSLVRWCMLPFLQVCSMIVDSVLDDGCLPDQCWDQTQPFGAWCDVVYLTSGSSFVASGPSWAWRLDRGPGMDWHERCGHRMWDE